MRTEEHHLEINIFFYLIVSGYKYNYVCLIELNAGYSVTCALIGSFLNGLCRFSSGLC